MDFRGYHAVKWAQFISFEFENEYETNRTRIVKENYEDLDGKQSIWFLSSVVVFTYML